MTIQYTKFEMELFWSLAISKKLQKHLKNVSQQNEEYFDNFIGTSNKKKKKQIKNDDNHTLRFDMPVAKSNSRKGIT